MNEAAVPSAVSVFLVFLRIGTTSFGGGMSGWMYKEIVEQRRWLEDDKFFASLTLAQVLPGPVPVNMAVYAGLQICGWRGGVAAAVGMVAPAFGIILALALLYDHFGSVPAVQSVLAGFAAVGIGVTASMGLRRLVRLRRDYSALLVTALVFIAVAGFQSSMLSVILLGLPPSILLAYVHDRRRNHG